MLITLRTMTMFLKQKSKYFNQINKILCSICIINNCGTCICKEIKIIQNFIKKSYNNINLLKNNVNYKSYIKYEDINSFIVSTKNNNDYNNKKRESIICDIINNKIPNDYYKYSFRWYKLKREINSYIDKLCKNKNIIIINNIECIYKAGRKHHYDFQVIINKNIIFNVEFKFNVEYVSETPQFVSPMKPSQYLEKSYEEYYYDNYLINIINEYGFLLPTKEEYLNKIHSTNPKCISKLQKKYYNGCEKSSKFTGNENDIDFYNKLKEISKKSIKDFITEYDLKIDNLSSYLLESQENKYYMLYKNSNIYLETINPDNYVITNYKKEPELQRYTAITKTGLEMKILLRWKNGNGIAYPAFQIS